MSKLLLKLRQRIFLSFTLLVFMYSERVQRIIEINIKWTELTDKVYLIKFYTDRRYLIQLNITVHRIPRPLDQNYVQ